MTAIKPPIRSALGLDDELEAVARSLEPRIAALEPKPALLEPKAEMLEQKAAVLEPKAPALDFSARARGLKFRTAKAYKDANKLSSAVGLLMELYRERPMSAEGEQALEMLTEIATSHEAAGRGRLAIELYQKLSEE
jgi:hypothetical protein